MKIGKEQLAAFADGQLAGEERTQVEAAIAADPSLARDLKAHRALRDRLREHFDPILDQPVPGHLAALLEPTGDVTSDDPTKVASFAEARRKRGLLPAVRRWAPIAGPTLAASLVLAVWQPWQGNAPPEGYADASLAAALDTQLAATQPDDAETRILLSFEAAGGELCRAFSGGTLSGIACRDQTGWRLERMINRGPAQTTEFRQAGSEQQLFAAAQEMAVSGALDRNAETVARRRGWRTSR